MESSGTLFVVATPIGNLGDITLRALETFKSVDAILCEDTRVTGKLLKHYEISKPLVSCHEHTDREKLGSLVERMQRGENMALVTDAGTPGLSDPGNLLVSLAREGEIAVVPIPGVSALGAIVSVAGIDMREFLFKGFPPHKKGRQTFFTEVAASEVPVVYYDSVHRVVKNMELLSTLAPEKRVIIGRELTKMFEEVTTGSVVEAKEFFEKNQGKVKGEFVVIAYNK